MAAENSNALQFKDAMLAMQQKSFYEKRTKYSFLNKYTEKGQIVFTGSSLMEFFPIEEMQMTLNNELIIYNRSLAGATTAELLDAINECIFQLEPSKLFINIGSNDIGSVGSGSYKLENLLTGYSAIMDEIRIRLPECKVFVMAYYPVNAEADFGMDIHQKEEFFKTRSNKAISEANAAVRTLALSRGFYYVDFNGGLTDEAGNLRKEFSIDGIHMWPNAYAVILENMKQYL